MPAAAKKDIVTIGGSAGSGTVLKQLLAELPRDLPATLLVTTHIPAHAAGLLHHNLASTASLPVSQAVDGQPIEHGHVYVAAPDRHLLLIGETLRLGEGPRENMARPSIDALFRSAALSCGPRVVGVVLTGMLDDGAAGLDAIKSRGGTAVVQHPLDAEVDQMPLAALQAVDVDHVVRADALAHLLAEVVRTEAGPALPASDGLRLEVDIAAGMRVGSAGLRQLADPSPLSCPDCHGVLSEVRGSGPLRFRCQIGHAYSAEALASRGEELDTAIRLAMRIMEERVTLVERMAQDARQAGRAAVAELHEARAREYRGYATTLREAAIASLRFAGAPREQAV